MFEIKGKYSKAKIFTDIIEEEAISQIYQMCNHPIFQDASICIMPDCLTEETEILTLNGFKYIKNLKKDEQIANVCDDNKVFFAKPLDVIIRDLRDGEKVYEIKDKNGIYSIKSTENHRNSYKNEMGIKTKELPNNLFLKDFLWNGSGLSIQIDYDISDIDLQLLAWIVGDGNIHVTHNKKSDSRRIRFGLKKARKIKRILNLLDSSNLKYSIYEDKKQTSIYLDVQSSKWFIDFLGLEKKLPMNLITKLSKRQAKLFLEEAIQVDGDYQTYIANRGMRYNSKDIDFINFISALFSLNFGTTNIRSRTCSGFKAIKMYYINCVYDDNLNYAKSGLHNTKLLKQELDYIGKVVCVTCDTGFFIARQNGRTFVTGNCHSGAGCTIGTTILMNKKAIIPNIVGVDVGCGVLTTIFQSKEDIDFKMLDTFINQKIPSGMTIRNGKHSALSNDVKLAIREIVEELKLGDLNKYLNSVGTLGGGNHYIEIGKINENTYVLSVHTGSRNLGKKVCEHFQLKATEYIRGSKNIEFERKKLVSQLKNEHREKEINEELKKLKNNSNYEIIGIPTDMAYIEDEDYDSYIRNMVKCQKMAAENRRLISLDILDFLNVKSLESFDTIHNYVELLESGSIVIRKGAISAKEGEKLAIPLNMRDGVIIGIGKGNDDWNQSAPHGAGRLMSRSKAKASVSMEEFQESMKGIQSWSVCNSTLDESPQAYKPASTIIEQVKETIEIIEIIKPVYNFKSHAETKSWSDIKKEEKAKKNQRGIDDESMDTNERDER